MQLVLARLPRPFACALALAMSWTFAAPALAQTREE
jgi:hypothetical protein